MKRVRIVIAAVVSIVLCTQAAFAAAPHDIQRHPAGSAIHTMMESDVISGYPDGRFRPDHPLTRAEAAKIFATLIEKMELAEDGYRPAEETVSEQKNEELAEQEIKNEIELQADAWFADVNESHWAWSEIKALTERGIINGYPDGSFRPNDSMTRAQFAVMIYTYLETTHWEGGGNVSFSDIEGSFAETAIRVLGASGVICGYSGGTFKPDAKILRGEAALALQAISGITLQPIEVTLPSYNVISAPYISQLYPVSAVVGCEPTSLLTGLKAKNYAMDVDLRTFMDNMPKHASNPAKGFVGSPYVADKSKKTRTTIYPAKLTEYASQYGKVMDFSGSSLTELQAELLAGNPVVIYVTMRWEKPFYRTYMIEGQPQWLLSNNHAVLVCGYDSENNRYYISDPYNDTNLTGEYKYWISGEILEPLYNERRHAIVVE